MYNLAATADELNSRLATVRALWADISSRSSEYSVELETWSRMLNQIENRMNKTGVSNQAQATKDVQTLDEAIVRMNVIKETLKGSGILPGVLPSDVTGGGGGGEVVSPSNGSTFQKMLPVVLIGAAVIGAVLFFRRKD